MEKHAPGSESCHSLVSLWKQWDENDTTKSEIDSLMEEENYEEVHNRLCTRMAFGTAGLRGSMQAGFNHMNDLVIIQTTQGLCAHVISSIEDVKSRGIVVGFDGRHNSAKWARLVANIFIRKGIPVYLFSQINPTPFVVS